MREKITSYEKAAQYGGGAARNSQRADNLHGRKPAPFVGFQRPMYETDGSCAKKPTPPQRQERFADEEPKAPIRVGERFSVRIEMVKHGLTRVVEGTMEVLESMWVFTTWLFKVKINGIEQFFLWRLDWILAGRAAWWSRPQRLEKGCEAGTDATPAPASHLHLLPAPRNTIAGLLPAKCA